MDFFTWILLLMITVGSVFVLVAIIKQKENTNEPELNPKIEEIDTMSQSILKDFDQKYQELLFLYNLIDEKQKNVSEQPLLAPKATIDYKIEANADTDRGINPRFNNVIKLKNSGLTIDEIAKKLDMGKGEVSLIINLGAK